MRVQSPKSNLSAVASAKAEVQSRGRLVHSPQSSSIEHRASSIQHPSSSFSLFGFRDSACLRISAFGLRTSFLLALVLSLSASCLASPASLFQSGTNAYNAGDFSQAAEAFREAIAIQPVSGSLQNLGNAEWQCGKVGLAILAWEQALWVDPFNQPATGNLRYARKVAQLETPDLAWYEVVSTWLPVSWWAWIAGVSLWLAVGMTMLPGILRRRKSGLQQALAALGLMLFLLSVPAQYGVHTRSQIGFALEKDTPLRLTPTEHAQAITYLAPGDPARCESIRGDFLRVRTIRASGWIQKDQFGLICPAR